MNKINQIKTLLGMEVKLETKTLPNGVVIEAESFEAGNEVFAINEDEKIALPVGEYELEEGSNEILVVAEEGIIAEIKTKEEEAEEEVTEEAAEEEVVEQAMESEVAAPKKIVESISKEMFFSEIEALKSEIESLKLALEPKEEVKEEVELSAETVEAEKTEEEVKVELSEEVEPIAHNPEANSDKRKMFLYSQGGAKTTKQTVYNKLFGNK